MMKEMVSERQLLHVLLVFALSGNVCGCKTNESAEQGSALTVPRPSVQPAAVTKSQSASSAPQKACCIRAGKAGEICMICAQQ